MQPTYADVLREILTIVKYPNNKEKFIQEFEEINRLDAMANILPRLSRDLQEKVKANIHNPLEVQKYISAQEYNNELSKVSAEALGRFFQVISPVLNLEQKEKIAKVVTI